MNVKHLLLASALVGAFVIVGCKKDAPGANDKAPTTQSKADEMTPPKAETPEKKDDPSDVPAKADEPEDKAAAPADEGDDSDADEEEEGDSE